LNAPRESSVLFRYRLTPANYGWTETTRRELDFAALPPGAYRLEVEARDDAGTWGGYGGDFPFEIMTPWFRTGWAIAAWVIAPILLAAVLLRRRMSHATKRVRELVRIVQEKTADLQRANEELRRLSSLDPLTGLANRRAFSQTLEEECALSKKTNSPVSLLILDIDHFKALNDSEGHQRGDEHLVSVGAELSRLARRPLDLAARYGGEEFAIILPETRAADAAQIAESVRLAITRLELPHPSSPVAHVLTVSVGVATATPEWCSTPDELVAAADQALYRAKNNGRNRVEVAQREVCNPVLEPA